MATRRPPPLPPSMLARLFARWRTPAAAAQVASPSADHSAGRAARAAPAPAPAAPPDPPPVSAWHLLARRPAIDPAGAIAGWELRLSDWAVQRLTRAGGQRAMQETYGYALVQAARSVSEGGRRPLVSVVALD